MAQRKRFYGWVLIPVAWFAYGFGISPAFYSWGVFLPKLLEDLDLSRAEVGLVAMVFTLAYSEVGPLVGMAISRWGSRRVMTCGALVTALGLYLTSRADSVFDFYFSYSIVAGLGIGFSTIIPAQNLASNWFIKYRATAIAIVMTAGGIVARIIGPFHSYILANYTWRQGWVIFAALSVLVALVNVVLVRNSPEDMGQRPDGLRPSAADGAPLQPMAEQDETSPESPKPKPEPPWTAGEALKTRQFWLLVVAALGYAVPWGVVVNQGPLHFDDIGIDVLVVPIIISNMAFVSIFGRLSGALGDFISPPKLLGIALVVEALGVGGLLFARTEDAAQICALAIGVGFGVAYIAVATVFSAFFGRRAFATTAGTRIMITGPITASGPAVAGWVHDMMNSYSLIFGALVATTLIGAVAAFIAKPPVHPQEQEA